jgi:hypothetical protein
LTAKDAKHTENPDRLHLSMRNILQKPAIRYGFAASMISHVGQRNELHRRRLVHSAGHPLGLALGTFAVLQTLPAMLMLPFASAD